MASPALADGAVTVGQTLPPIYNCDGTYEIVQTGVASGTSFRVPSDGVITSWSSQGTAMGTTSLKIKFFRPTSVLGDYTVVGQSDLGSVPASSAVVTFPTRIPVRTGDLLGISKPTGGCAQAMTGANGDTYVFRAGDAPDGETDTYSSPNTQFRVDASAKLEPDADGDGFGDETQDGCPGDPGKVAGCPRADLLVTKAASAAEVPVGASITYTVTAYNLGPEHAPAVTVTDPPPAGLSAVTATSSAGICSLGPPVVCSIGELASGASATVTITATATAPGTLTNTASVSSAALTQAATAGAGDPDPSNNAASATTVVDAAPADRFAGVTLPAQVARVDAKGRAPIRIGCPAGTPGDCRGTLLLKAAKKRLGRASFTIQPGKASKVLVKLSRGSSRLVSKRGKLRAVATVTAKDGLGTTKTRTARVTLKARKKA
jgi:uncharacterized repeat protein (TIGR01451 family)